MNDLCMLTNLYLVNWYISEGKKFYWRKRLFPSSQAIFKLTILLPRFSPSFMGHTKSEHVTLFLWAMRCSKCFHLWVLLAAFSKPQNYKIKLNICSNIFLLIFRQAFCLSVYLY
jgi:hypothetical protein